MRILDLWIPGQPRPKGSMRAIPKRRKDGSLYTGVQNSNPETRVWQDLISWEAKAAMKGREPMPGPMIMSAMFYLKRRQAFDGQLVEEHTEVPDVDKLLRTVFDALTKIVYQDDCQVVTVVASKAYAGEKGPGLQLALGTAKEGT